MFGRRSSVADRFGGAAKSVVGYVDPLAKDERLRRRLVAAIAAGEAARRRVRRQAAMQGLAARLGKDPVLRAQLAEVATQLRAVRRRQEKVRSHKARNAVLFTAGVGLVAVAVAKRRRSREDWAPEGWGPAPSTRAIDEEIEVDAPVATAYGRWTQLDELSHVLRDRAARIVEQEPERRITWESADGADVHGSVVFEPASADRTRVHLHMTYRPSRVTERLGSAVGLDARRVRGELERFRELVEAPV